MKFTLAWLRDHLETDASLARITDTLCAIGLEVDGIEDRGAALAPFRTARIIEAVPHPNADRLRACRVDIGDGQTVSVVCGAPNARTGLAVVFAPPGAYVPGTGITLKVGEIRGVVSAGMLVSMRELALGEDHDGIIELPENTPAGLPYAAWAGLDDIVIEIGVTPNRGDALAVRGIARDLAAAGLGRLKDWAPAPVPPSVSTPLGWSIDWPEACPLVLGRSITGLTNGPSPAWLQRRLTAIGLRPISALVDITNFFTFDLGRPLHVFDADRIAGHTLHLRRGAGERFAALNGRDIVVGEADLVIADQSGVLSLAGIMGGASTGASADTRHVFLECALFDPVLIARSGRRHQLQSDARQRFERGLDPALPRAALEAATRMVLDLCGGEPGAIVGAGAEPAWQRRASLRLPRLATFGGATIAKAEATGILTRLGFANPVHDTDADGAPRLTLDVPSWRNDIAGSPMLDQSPLLDPGRAREAAEGAALIEPECDLIEEVLRIHGLDHIPAISLPGRQAVPAPSLNAAQTRATHARRLLAARGLAECVSYSFLPRATAALFGEADASLTLNNPIAADLDQMRPTPLASLALATARALARGAQNVGLFEIGPGFAPDAQIPMAAALRAGLAPRSTHQAAPIADAMAAKADLWALLESLGVPLRALSITTDAPAHYHPGQSGVVRQGPKIILAQFGTLHPSLRANLGIATPAAGFELFLDAIQPPRRPRRAAPDLPSLQPVRRDFAFLVARDTPAETVLAAARGADRTLITQVSLFDVYQGDQVPADQKSLGLEVVIQPRTQSLTEAEIEALGAKVVAAVAKLAGGGLR